MWHSLEISDVFKKLNSIKDGLSEQEAKKRLVEFGLNKLPEEKPVSKLRIFLRQFKSPLIYILAIAGLITVVLKDYTDAIIIFGAVLINTAIGYFQENKTNKILTELKKAVKEKAVIIREGNEKEIDSSEVVPGDILLVYSGDKVAADARIIEAFHLKANESVLTGEWVPAEKAEEALEKETPLADRDNMLYAGTIVEQGHGKAIVVSTGEKTEIGKIAGLIKETKDEKSPYQRKVTHLSRVIGLFILFLSVLLFVLGVLTGKEYLEMLITSVAVVVAAIPEGLPAAVTVTFAFGMREILKRKGLVRELVAAEVLGSTSVICADKTGTLTQAKMQVAGIYTGERELLSDSEKYYGEIDKNGTESHITALKIATLTNTAFVENPEDDFNQWVVRGEPTEKALLLAGMQAGLNKKELVGNYPQIDEFPFDSILRYSATLHRHSETENILYVLGAPEVILEKSELIDIDGVAEKLGRGKSAEIASKIEELTQRGERVVAAAYKLVPPAKNCAISSELVNELVFVGLIGLKDPLRHDARAAISSCKRAGLNPVLVTGDHKLTAKRIAEEIGLIAEGEQVIEGRELDKMSDEEFFEKLERIKIYARVEPEHKTRIVAAWQRKGEIVAMTGDGVNDAPALKKANIGVALNSGTEVAKEAADLILLNDSFSIIVTAVEEGRKIMDNIRKILAYFLMGGFTEIILIGLSVIFRLPLPVLPGQILWTNLIEDTPPAMALTLEPKEKDIMQRKPENPGVPLLTSEIKILVFFVGVVTDIILFGLFWWLLKKDFPLALIRTIIFGGLVIDSLFFIFSCRNLKKNIWRYNPFSNMYVNFAVILGFLMLGLAIYLPGLQKLLSTVPLGLFEWSLVLGLGFLNLILIEGVKWFYIRKNPISNTQ